MTKTKSTRSAEFAIIIIATYNNINKQKSLKKIKKERRMICKIKKQREKKIFENFIDQEIDRTFVKSQHNERKMCWRRVIYWA
jgi:phosphopantothenoylcysteine synthetase/decarboxylase